MESAGSLWNKDAESKDACPSLINAQSKFKILVNVIAIYHRCNLKEKQRIYYWHTISQPQQGVPIFQFALSLSLKKDERNIERQIYSSSHWTRNYLAIHFYPCVEKSSGE